MTINNPFENLNATNNKQTEVYDAVNRTSFHHTEDPFAFVNKDYAARQASYTKTKVTRYVHK